MQADRRPNPHAYEVKKVYQSIKVEPIDLAAGKVRVHNKYFFTNLNQFAASWILRRDGQEVANGSLGWLDVAPASQPGADDSIAVTTEPGEYLLTVSFALPDDTGWAAQGHCVAWDQLPVAVVPHPQIQPGGRRRRPGIDHAGHKFVVEGKNFRVAVNRQTGALDSYRDETSICWPRRWCRTSGKSPTTTSIAAQYIRDVGPWRDAAAHRQVNR